MIYIGIDPSLTSTGIIAVDSNDPDFWAAVNIVHSVTKPGKRNPDMFPRGNFVAKLSSNKPLVVILDFSPPE